uniref:Regulator of microtubule dynamics protein 2 n=1 Tax=Cebus imitator TaxID=2715852 RepID=A0A2K5Q6S2_CEBIM
MGKCLSCCKEDQSFQRCCPEDQVTTDAQHHGASSILQANVSLDHKTSYSPVTHKVNSAKTSRRLSSLSSPSFSERRCSLFARFQKGNASPYWQQSRANFDSEEDTSFTDLKSPSEHFNSLMSRRSRFLSRKLSIVSCYKSAIFFDPQASGQSVFNLNEIEIIFKTPSNNDAQNHITISAPEYCTKNFKNFEINTTSPAFRNSVDRASYQQSASSFFSLASDQQNGIATDIQQKGQLSKDLKDFLLPGSESYSTDHSPVMIQQHPSQSGTLSFLHKAGISSSYKDSDCFIPSENEVTSASFDDENRSSLFEIPKIKTLSERAMNRAPMNGHCHLWYAVLCGYVSEFEGLQNKINYGHLFKEHLDIAIKLLPEEPFLYYLKGRYCYTVSKLSWIEKKMAATLFGKVPSSTVQEALHSFLKAEELCPGYSIPNYMYLAKCYTDLEETQNALKFCNLALLLPTVTKER